MVRFSQIQLIQLIQKGVENRAENRSRTRARTRVRFSRFTGGPNLKNTVSEARTELRTG